MHDVRTEYIMYIEHVLEKIEVDLETELILFVGFVPQH